MIVEEVVTIILFHNYCYYSTLEGFGISVLNVSNIINLIYTILFIGLPSTTCTYFRIIFVYNFWIRNSFFVVFLSNFLYFRLLFFFLGYLFNYLFIFSLRIWSLHLFSNPLFALPIMHRRTLICLIGKRHKLSVVIAFKKIKIRT